MENCPKEKCAKFEAFLQNQPDKLDFTVANGMVRLAGLDETFNREEIHMMLHEKLKLVNASDIENDLMMKKHASVETPKDAIPLKKEAENTAVVVDMYEVDYTPNTEGQSTQEIVKSFNATKDFVSRMTFPDTTVPDIIVGPKEQVFKKHEIKVKHPELPSDTGHADIPSQLRQSIWKPVQVRKASIWKKTELEDNEWAEIRNILHALWQQDTRNFPREAENYIIRTFGLDGIQAQEIVNKFLHGRNTQALTAPTRHDNLAQSNHRWHKQADTQDHIETLIQEGLKDELEGRQYWLNVAKVLKAQGLSSEASDAMFIATQEQTHHAFLQDLQKKLNETTASPKSDPKVEEILSYLKRNYDMLPTDVVNHAAEEYHMPKRQIWKLYEQVRADFGERRGVQKSWMKMAANADNEWMDRPAMSVYKMARLGMLADQRTRLAADGQPVQQAQTVQQMDPQQQYQQTFKQQDGMFRYTYRDASVMINPTSNTMVVNVWVQGQDNKAVNAGIARATVIGQQSLQYYAREIQLPAQLAQRQQHTLQGGYVSVPFTIQVANQQQQPTASWKSMASLMKESAVIDYYALKVGRRVDTTEGPGTIVEVGTGSMNGAILVQLDHGSKKFFRSHTLRELD